MNGAAINVLSNHKNSVIKYLKGEGFKPQGQEMGDRYAKTLKLVVENMYARNQIIIDLLNRLIDLKMEDIDSEETDNIIAAVLNGTIEPGVFNLWDRKEMGWQFIKHLIDKKVQDGQDPCITFEEVSLVISQEA